MPGVTVHRDLLDRTASTNFEMTGVRRDGRDLDEREVVVGERDEPARHPAIDGDA